MKLNECINIIYNRSNIKKKHNYSTAENLNAFRERMDTENIFINEFKILFNRI